jgi:formate dehydrogenase major subunit
MTNPDSAPSVNTLADTAKTGSELFIDGKAVAVPEGELLLEAILREKQIPYVCYHSPLMGPIRSYDTCLVEVNGTLERACGMEVSPGLQVVTSSDCATSARSEAFDVILTNHMFYCSPAH